MPVYASAQTPERITILESFGDYKRGEPLFVYGQIGNFLDDSFLIMQIVNPEGDLCQIQQLVPLANGAFITDVIPLDGRICGISGEYEIKLFYGDYSKSTTFFVSTDSFSEPDEEQMRHDSNNSQTQYLGQFDWDHHLKLTLFFLWWVLIHIQNHTRSTCMVYLPQTQQHMYQPSYMKE